VATLFIHVFPFLSGGGITPPRPRYFCTSWWACRTIDNFLNCEFLLLNSQFRRPVLFLLRYSKFDAEVSASRSIAPLGSFIRDIQYSIFDSATTSDHQLLSASRKTCHVPLIPNSK
jgi:hypothetical protein